jgi:uncharacterized short protein YbdD (DUF466 family)
MKVVARTAIGLDAPLTAIAWVRVAVPRLMHLAVQTARLMVGIPDYQAYVRHRQTFHRGEAVMSYSDFYRDRQKAHYAVEKGGFRGIC